MANYPTSIPMLTSVRPLSRNIIEFAEDGNVRGQNLIDRPAYGVTVLHEWITAEQMQTLETFVESNGSNLITIVAGDGHTYDCLLDDLDFEVDMKSGTRRHARIRLTGNRPATSSGGGGGSETPYTSLSVDFSTETIAAGLLSSDARYYRNASLGLSLAAADSPRYQRGLDGLVQGILLERGNTSWLRHNTAFSEANGWTHANITPSSTSVASIFGSNDAYEFNEGTNLNVPHNINRTLVSAAGDIADDHIVCAAAIVEYVDMPYVALGLPTKDGQFPSQRFNISPMGYAVGSSFVGTTTQYSAGIKYIGNGRHLIWASWSVGAGATIPKAQLLGASPDGTTNVYDGTSRSFKVHAFWADDGAYPQMPVIVGAAAVTKAADSLIFSQDHQPDNGFLARVKLIGRDVSRIVGAPREGVVYESGDFSIRVTDNDVIAKFGGTTISHVIDLQPDSEYDIAVGKDTSGAYLWINGGDANGDPQASSAALTAAITPGPIYVGSNTNRISHADVPIVLVSVDQWSGIAEAA